MCMQILSLFSNLVLRDLWPSILPLIYPIVTLRPSLLPLPYPFPRTTPSLPLPSLTYPRTAPAFPISPGDTVISLPPLAGSATLPLSVFYVRFLSLSRRPCPQFSHILFLVLYPFPFSPVFSPYSFFSSFLVTILSLYLLSFHFFLSSTTFFSDRFSPLFFLWCRPLVVVLLRDQEM